jgi:hypothetical protein
MGRTPKYKTLAERRAAQRETALRWYYSNRDTVRAKSRKQYKIDKRKAAKQ